RPSPPTTEARRLASVSPFSPRPFPRSECDRLGSPVLLPRNRVPTALSPFQLERPGDLS
ncbi:unnamed protein product, partial [Musa acuminata subsp. burmannicoides]